MNNNFAIEVDSVSKKFCKNLKYIVLYGINDIVKSILGLKVQTEKLRLLEFWALNNLSFKIKSGETIALIGANGSGKSTLLKLFSGIFMPDTGQIKIRGKVGALIDVGAGFHPMLTGRDNIYINGSILGMNRKEMDKKFDDIVKFAEIEDFLDTPVKNYSSGMYVRLGFSIAIHCVPDILLVDEVLSIGDARFQKKSLNKMRDIINSHKTIIFVSHNMKTVASFTKKAIYLRNGKIAAIGPTKEIIKQYLSENNQIND